MAANDRSGMEYRRLGRTGLKVSTVSLGSWLTFGSSVADDTTKECVDLALELGINFFDTADIYSRGEGELALGRAIAGLTRHHLVIASKCFWPMSDHDPNDRGLSVGRHRNDTPLGRLAELSCGDIAQV